MIEHTKGAREARGSRRRRARRPRQESAACRVGACAHRHPCWSRCSNLRPSPSAPSAQVRTHAGPRKTSTRTSRTRTPAAGMGPEPGGRGPPAQAAAADVAPANVRVYK